MPRSALALVKVRVSPTSYFVPASSTSIPLTEPRFVWATSTSAKPLPIFSTAISSSSECKIPSFVTVPELTIALTVKPTVTSLVVEFPVILSPSLNVPTTLPSTSSVIESLPCLNACADMTVAVAPNNCPFTD